MIKGHIEEYSMMSWRIIQSDIDLMTLCPGGAPRVSGEDAAATAAGERLSGRLPRRGNDRQRGGPARLVGCCDVRVSRLLAWQFHGFPCDFQAISMVSTCLLLLTVIILHYS